MRSKINETQKAKENFIIMCYCLRHSTFEVSEEIKKYAFNLYNKDAFFNRQVNDLLNTAKDYFI